MTITMTIETLIELSKAGRVAGRGSCTYGQTDAGCHSAVGAERMVEVQEAPCGGHVVEGPPIYTMWAGKPVPIHHDPETGEVWWGATFTLRVLPYAGAPLFGAETFVDADNLAYQRGLLGR